MRLFWTFSFLAVALSFTLSAYAGGRSSGGGNGIICFGKDQKDLADEVRAKHLVADALVPKIQSIESLDLFLAKQDDSSFSAINLKKGETITQYIDRLVTLYQPDVPALYSLVENSQKIAHYRPVKGPLRLQNDTNAIISTSIKNVQTAKGLNNLRFFYDDRGNLKEIAAYGDPEKYVSMPDNCAVVDIAQTYVEFEGEQDSKTFGLITYDARLFNHAAISKENRAAVMLHEFLYLQGLLRNHIDSSQTRNVLKAMIRKNDRLSPKDFELLLKDNNFLEPVATELQDHPSDVDF